jgi:outer membrane receptor protein involved in Fe transport
VDGVPANDPFGGWVYWRALPRLGIQRVEVVPGGASALYGNYALGGVTQVVSRPIAPRSLDADVEYGSFDTWRLGLRAAARRGAVGAAVEGEWFRSDGYPVVAPYDRGPVDGDTPGEHGTLDARVEVRASPDLTLNFRGGWFDEDQNGGTEHTTAAVERFTWGAGLRFTPAAGALDLSVFGQSGRFGQERARISGDRSSEVLSAVQDVPIRDLGAGLVWTFRPLSLAGRHALTVGTDLRRITGETREDLFPPAVEADTVVGRDAGGEQRLYGLFVQDVYDVSPAVAFTAALRWDRWDNVGASREVTLGDGSTARVDFPDRSDATASPKLGARLRPAGWLTLRAAAYRSFRAPTLNELYRPFQVGTVRTLANEDLGPETLLGGEAGVEVEAASVLTARATGFWNELEDPIVNVTLDPAVDPDLRQRQNLGRARIRGVEAEVGWRISRTWLATAGYTFVDSEVVLAPGQPQLVGKDLPQDPRHRWNVSLAFDDPRLLAAAVQVRWLGRQYEDDLNTLPMDGVALVDVSASRALGRGATLYLAVENLLDEQYLVGRAGVDTIGQPRFVHGGVRLRTGG